MFRGSDVKDLRVEEPPAAKENKPPQVPNDPAILGVSVHILQPLAPFQFDTNQLALSDEEFSDVKSLLSPRAQNHVEIFRCLPSDYHKLHRFFQLDI